MPETAIASLKIVLKAKDIRLAENSYPLQIVRNDSFEHEEFEITAAANKTVLAAADADGLRRGIYFIEDLIRSLKAKQSCLLPSAKNLS